MNILSGKDLKGDQGRKWAEERRKLFRGILKDPRASQHTKDQARAKIEEVRPQEEEGR